MLFFLMYVHGFLLASFSCDWQSAVEVEIVNRRLRCKSQKGS